MTSLYIYHKPNLQTSVVSYFVVADNTNPYLVTSTSNQTPLQQPSLPYRKFPRQCISQLKKKSPPRFWCVCAAERSAGLSVCRWGFPREIVGPALPSTRGVVVYISRWRGSWVIYIYISLSVHELRIQVPLLSLLFISYYSFLLTKNVRYLHHPGTSFHVHTSANTECHICTSSCQICTTLRKVHHTARTNIKYQRFPK